MSTSTCFLDSFVTSHVPSPSYKTRGRHGVSIITYLVPVTPTRGVYCQYNQYNQYLASTYDMYSSSTFDTRCADLTCAAQCFAHTRRIYPAHANSYRRYAHRTSHGHTPVPHIRRTSCPNDEWTGTTVLHASLCMYISCLERVRLLIRLPAVVGCRCCTAVVLL